MLLVIIISFALRLCELLQRFLFEYLLCWRLVVVENGLLVDEVEFDQLLKHIAQTIVCDLRDDLFFKYVSMNFRNLACFYEHFVAALDLR